MACSKYWSIKVIDARSIQKGENRKKEKNKKMSSKNLFVPS